MKTHTILITETYKRKVKVPAASATSAIDLAVERWSAGEYFLDPDCFREVRFTANSDKGEVVAVIPKDGGDINIAMD